MDFELLDNASLLEAKGTWTCRDGIRDVYLLRITHEFFNRYEIQMQISVDGDSEGSIVPNNGTNTMVTRGGSVITVPILTNSQYYDIAISLSSNSKAAKGWYQIVHFAPK
ncbi:MAG: hypothetical protein ABL949_06075 [Fimbriimonadaceae bacterium]